MYREDTDCIQQLAAPAKRVLGEGSFIGREPSERRIGLWNEIKMNRDRYLDGECGAFLPDMDRHFRGLFDASLLLLGSSFAENGDDFPAATEFFTPQERASSGLLEKSRVFEIYSDRELKIKLLHKDKEVLEVLRRYYLFGNTEVEAVLDNPDIRLSLKHYYNWKWSSLKKRINNSVSTLITEVDYLVPLVEYWNKESRRIADVSGENARHEALGRVEAHESALLDTITEQEETIEELRETVGEQEKRIRSAFAAVDLGDDARSRHVTLGEVKQYEMNFLERMGRKLSDLTSFEDVRYQTAKSDEQEMADAHELAAIWGLSSTDRDNLPKNTCLTVAFEEKKLLGKKKALSAVAAFFSRPERYASAAFDTDPAGSRDINPLLDRMRREAKKSGTRTLLCIASPTGFDHLARSYIGSDTFYQNFSSQYLSVCLLDVETAEVIYHPADTAAVAWAKVCHPELPAETELRIEEEVEDAVSAQFMNRSWAVFDEIQKEIDEDPALVKRFFYQYAGVHDFTVRHVDDVGLVMMEHGRHGL